MSKQIQKVPTIVKNILIEAYYDFESVDMNENILKINLNNILTKIFKGKDELNIIEASVLFEAFYKGYDDFNKSKDLDTDKLENDTLNYYEYLLKKYSKDIDFKQLNPNNPLTLIMMKDSINCENFILVHYIKLNFNIIYVGDDLTDS